MRRLSTLLMGLGVALGAGVSAAMLLHVGIPAMHWLILVGLVKLALAGSLGLIAAGASARRLAIRAEQRKLGAITTEAKPRSPRQGELQQ